jgi:hypothetical protein
MNAIWNWVLKHPQRTAGLLLTAFGSLQGSLALYQASFSPTTNALITTLFGLVVALLGWVKSNVDETETKNETA